MSLQAKYSSVIALTETVGMVNPQIGEENGALKIAGLVATQYQKDQLWNTIKKVDANAADIVADIAVAETAYYTKHVVQKGESLSLIAKQYCGDMMKYKAIFEANRHILSDENSIEVGQELIIPNLV